MRRATRNLLAPTTPEPTEQTICRHVISLNFSYFDGTGWYDEWDSTQQDNRLPVAVEIALQLRPPRAAASLPSNEELEAHTITHVFHLPATVGSGSSQTDGSR